MNRHTIANQSLRKKTVTKNYNSYTSEIKHLREVMECDKTLKIIKKGND